VAQQGVAVCEIIEMVIEARLAVDQPVGGQDRTVGVEDELSDLISGVDQPDERLIGVGHIKQLVVIDLSRHEAIVSAISRVDMSRRARDLLRIVAQGDRNRTGPSRGEQGRPAHLFRCGLGRLFSSRRYDVETR
jgi:hypothetical protein